MRRQPAPVRVRGVARSKSHKGREAAGLSQNARVVLDLHLARRGHDEARGARLEAQEVDAVAVVVLEVELAPAPLHDEVPRQDPLARVGLGREPRALEAPGHGLVVVVGGDVADVAGAWTPQAVKR
jgi:hypothetical protein